MPATARVAAALLLGLALVPAGAHGRIAGRSVRLRMEGYVGPPPAGRLEQADLVLRVGKADVRFQVVTATVLSGSVLAANVFAEAAPYKPSYYLRGPKELLARVDGAAPGTRLVLIGQWIVGTRDLFLASVEPASPAG